MWDQDRKNELKQQVEVYLEKHASLVPKPGKVHYGTAGFRGPVDQIGWIFYRAGIMTALRCFELGQAMGVMITASHNPIGDNGVKFIDEHGQMLAPAWELIFDEACNIQNTDAFVDAIDKVIKERAICCDVRPTRAQVFVGCDTRPSSEKLVEAVMDGIGAMAGSLIPVTNFGLCTTPELHWLVAEANKRCPDREPVIEKQLYWEQLSAGFIGGVESREQNGISYDPSALVVDCANGVGKVVMQQMQKALAEHLPLELINTGGAVNESCGADFVKTQKKPPAGADSRAKRYASLDGDADRLVYFYLEGEDSSSRELKLLDGDRIQALFALYVSKILKGTEYEGLLSIGCIQTAYANGACTDFLRDTGFRVDFTDTGVKNLERQAANYDIGIYFESNGHGTIHLSARALNIFMCDTKDSSAASAGDHGPSAEKERKSDEFKTLCTILNVYTGDGISDIMLVEHILRYFDWDVGKWYSLYADRPSRLIKLAVKNKNLISTVDAGRKCRSPNGLQAEIDSIVARFGPRARCFVRASGTEDVARVYAEADTQEEADEIAKLVGEKTVDYC